MSFRTRVLIAGALVSGIVGCAHCDTCDDFPGNCVGGACGNQVYATGTTVAVDAPVMGGGPGGPIMAPAGQPGPFAAPAAGAAAAPAPPPVDSLRSEPARPDTPPTPPASAPSL
jgi:hypothetical protein